MPFVYALQCPAGIIGGYWTESNRIIIVLYNLDTVQNLRFEYKCTKLRISLVVKFSFKILSLKILKEGEQAV